MSSCLPPARTGARPQAAGAAAALRAWQSWGQGAPWALWEPLPMLLPELCPQGQWHPWYQLWELVWGRFAKPSLSCGTSAPLQLLPFACFPSPVPLLTPRQGKPGSSTFLAGNCFSRRPFHALWQCPCPAVVCALLCTRRCSTAHPGGLSARPLSLLSLPARLSLTLCRA